MVIYGRQALTLKHSDGRPNFPSLKSSSPFFQKDCSLQTTPGLTAFAAIAVDFHFCFIVLLISYFCFLWGPFHSFWWWIMALHWSWSQEFYWLWRCFQHLQSSLVVTRKNPDVLSSYYFSGGIIKFFPRKLKLHLTSEHTGRMLRW